MAQNSRLSGARRAASRQTPTRRAASAAPEPRQENPRASEEHAEGLPSKAAVYATLKAAESLSIEEAEMLGEVSKRLWVVNTAQGPGDKGGDVYCNIVGDGGTEVIRVPRSWLPTDVTLQANRLDILDSREFRKFVDSGTLTIIGDDVAAVLNADPDAKHERDRLARGSTPEAESEEDFADVAPAVKNLCRNMGEPWSRKIALIRTLLPSLTPQDKSYLLRNVPTSETRLRQMLA